MSDVRLPHVDDEGAAYQAAAEREAVEHDVLVQAFAAQLTTSRARLEHALAGELEDLQLDRDGRVTNTVGNVVASMALQGVITDGWGRGPSGG